MFNKFTMMFLVLYSNFFSMIYDKELVDRNVILNEEIFNREMVARKMVSYEELVDRNVIFNEEIFNEEMVARKILIYEEAITAQTNSEFKYKINLPNSSYYRKYVCEVLQKIYDDCMKSRLLSTIDHYLSIEGYLYKFILPKKIIYNITYYLKLVEDVDLELEEDDKQVHNILMSFNAVSLIVDREFVSIENFLYKLIEPMGTIISSLEISQSVKLKWVGSNKRKDDINLGNLTLYFNYGEVNPVKHDHFIMDSIELYDEFRGIPQLDEERTNLLLGFFNYLFFSPLRRIEIVTKNGVIYNFFIKYPELRVPEGGESNDVRSKGGIRLSEYIKYKRGRYKTGIVKQNERYEYIDRVVIKKRYDSCRIKFIEITD